MAYTEMSDRFSVEDNGTIRSFICRSERKYPIVHQSKWTEISDCLSVELYGYIQSNICQI